jgi:Tfp pilus assembly protein PilF
MSFRTGSLKAPRSTEVYADLAKAYQRKGDIPSAVENYRKALEMNPRDVKIQKALAQLEKKD